MNPLPGNATRYRWPVTAATAALAVAALLVLAAPPLKALGEVPEPAAKPHVFVPTEVQLPAHDDPPAPTF